MAIEYTLMIDSQLNLTQATHFLSNRKDIEIQSDDLKAPGMTINIERADQEDQTFVQEHFFFTPRLALFFVQDKLADFKLAHSTLIQITIALLNQGDGDAILDFNGDTILFRRIKHQLFLYQDDPDFWKPFLLNWIPQPYELALTTQRENAQVPVMTNESTPCDHPATHKNRLIHLEPAVAQFIAQIANNKHKSMDEIVNAWLKKDIGNSQSLDFEKSLSPS
ncbi:MAG: hypothetical protein DRQ99_06975 [Candidatus Parabeggiatoa sp. nov. 3]|jgi:hypothetical protein|nr:MAG: hypothetical protein DRQ99_06975 [Gammaproteobacteria bacterium]